ncbi:MAG TPA: lipocalin family protein [Ignavibacteriaceae bacterium]|jgi:apolipoprotein D and lipocalin family protein|nr:lipocalin family protein [Ignavibacteriaceae bacterium]
MKKIFLFAVILGLAGCSGIPDNVTPITGFELDKYLGKWYEIARLDHSFERDLDNVTADYSMRDDGGVKVINRGFNTKKGEWKTAEGKAYFIDKPDVGMLKVSFFLFFYGGYNIIALDKENYSYSMVCGPDLSYLWILSREKNMEKELLDSLIGQAKSLGFETDKLIFVKHDKE